MNKIIARVLFFCALISLASCGGGSDKKTPEKCVPKDAMFSLRVDPAMLASKGLNLEELTAEYDESGMFQKLKSAGVSFDQPYYIFGNIDMQNNGGYFASVSVVSDDKKMKEFFNSEFEDVQRIDEDDISYAAAEERNAYYVYKPGVLMFLQRADYVAEGEQEQIKRLMTLSEEESAVGTDSLFQSQLSAGYDFAAWLNIEEFLDTYGGDELNVIAGFIDFKNTYASYGFRFEKGKIILETNRVSNKETIGYLNGIMSKSGLSKEMLSVMPANDLLATAGVSLNTEGVKTFLKEKKLVAQINEGLRIPQVSVEDILDAFTGEFGVTYNGMALQEIKSGADEVAELLEGDIEELGLNPEDIEGILEADPEPIPMMSFTIGFNGKTPAGLVLGQLFETTALRGFQKEGDWWVSEDRTRGIRRKSDYIQLVTSNELIEKGKTGRFEAIDEITSKKLADNPTFVWADIKSLVSNSKIVPDMKMQLESVEQYLPFKSISGVDKVENGAIVGTWTIEMKDDSKNSLTTLVELGQQLKSFIPL